MFSSTARKATVLTDTQQIDTNDSNVLSRKIWLPKLLYNGLPYFYLGAGLTALLATLYISDWFWVLPHYLLFSGACLHLGVMVFARRRNRDNA
ncbi:MAG: hypothetical protein WBN09_06345 [Woeseiaceae bacterium]